MATQSRNGIIWGLTSLVATLGHHGGLEPPSASFVVVSSTIHALLPLAVARDRGLLLAHPLRCFVPAVRAVTMTQAPVWLTAQRILVHWVLPRLHFTIVQTEREREVITTATRVYLQAAGPPVLSRHCLPGGHHNSDQMEFFRSPSSAQSTIIALEP